MRVHPCAHSGILKSAANLLQFFDIRKKKSEKAKKTAFSL